MQATKRIAMLKLISFLVLSFTSYASATGEVIERRTPGLRLSTKFHTERSLLLPINKSINLQQKRRRALPKHHSSGSSSSSSGGSGGGRSHGGGHSSGHGNGYIGCLGYTSNQLKNKWRLKSQAPTCGFAHYSKDGDGSGNSTNTTGSSNTVDDNSSSGDSSSSESSGAVDADNVETKSENGEEADAGDVEASAEDQSGTNDNTSSSSSSNGSSTSSSSSGDSSSSGGSSSGSSSSGNTSSGGANKGKSAQEVTNENFEDLYGEDDEYDGIDDETAEQDGRNANNGEDNANGNSNNNDNNNNNDNANNNNANNNANNNNGNNNNNNENANNGNENANNNEAGNGNDNNNNNNDNGNNNGNNNNGNNNGNNNNNNNNGNDDEENAAEDYDPYQDFDIGQCDTYENLWLWDLALTCENDVLLDSCQCTFASELMDLKQLSCADIKKCPRGCKICKTCLKLLGCSDEGNNFLDFVSSPLWMVIVGAAIVTCLVCFYCAARRRLRESEDQQNGYLGVHLMSGDDASSASGGSTKRTTPLSPLGSPMSSPGSTPASSPIWLAPTLPERHSTNYSTDASSLTMPTLESEIPNHRGNIWLTPVDGSIHEPNDYVVDNSDNYSNISEIDAVAKIWLAPSLDENAAADSYADCQLPPRSSESTIETPLSMEPSQYSEPKTEAAAKVWLVPDVSGNDAEGDSNTGGNQILSEAVDATSPEEPTPKEGLLSTETQVSSDVHDMLESLSPSGTSLNDETASIYTSI